MTAVLVDANVLLDIITEDATWFAWSSEAIARAADRHRLVINPVIYAEVSVRFSRIEDWMPRCRKSCSSARRSRTKPPSLPASRS